MQADTSDPSAGGALILAAGFGRRFGSDKRRYQLADGRTLLQATLDCYAAVYPQICLVLRRGDEALARAAAELPIPVRISISDQAAKGMGHSLAAGVGSILADWDWASVALGDMPFTKTQTLRELLGVFHRSPSGSIVVPVYDGVAGHPVTFPSSCFQEMLELTGDRGARPIIAAHEEQVIRHPVTDPGVLQDLDAPLQEAPP